MKRQISFAIFAIILLVGIGSVGCENPASTEVDSSADLSTLEVAGLSKVDVGGTTESATTLWAGKHIDAGTVSYSNVDGILTVTYTTTGGWELVETHFAIGCALSDLPTNKPGNPVVGHFPYKSGNIAGSTSYSFVVDLASTPCGYDSESENVYVVAAHAEVRHAGANGTYTEESAWAEGDRFVQRGNWATYTTITVTSDGGTDPVVVCNSAYAFAPFGPPPEYVEGQGWALIATPPTVFDLYAGEPPAEPGIGQVPIGTVSVDYDFFFGTTTVTFVVNDGFTLSETELYFYDVVFGGDGSFSLGAPISGDVVVVADESGTTVTYTVTNLPSSFPGLFYVAANATVCAPEGSW